MTLICLVIFVGTVAITRFVSLGSILVVLALAACAVYFGSHGYFGLGEEYLTEFYVLAAAIALLAIWRHRANIGRLIHGTESKLGEKKKS